MFRNSRPNSLAVVTMALFGGTLLKALFDCLQVVDSKPTLHFSPYIKDAHLRGLSQSLPALASQVEPPHNQRSRTSGNLPDDAQNVRSPSQSGREPLWRAVTRRRYSDGSKTRPYVCDVCGKRFSSIVGHKLHVDRHKGVYPLKCQYCGKGFTCKSNLRGHLTSHMNVFEFKCDFCQKEFRYKKDLVAHIQRSHSDEATFAETLAVLSYQQQYSGATSTLDLHHRPATDIITLEGSIDLPNFPRMQPSSEHDVLEPHRHLSNAGHGLKGERNSSIVQNCSDETKNIAADT